MIQTQLSLLPRYPQEIAPGAWHVPAFLSPEQQQELLSLCREAAKPPAGMYRPKTPTGLNVRVKVVCLGWHWYPYRYSKTRDDSDRLPVKPFPLELTTLANRAIAATLPEYLPFQPDSAIINWYSPDSQLGMHQDRSESPEALKRGSPVVTLSLGDRARFRFGNTKLDLHSGDLFVFGGASRLTEHAILRIFPNTAPPELGTKQGRLSVTIRETGFSLNTAPAVIPSP